MGCDAPALMWCDTPSPSRWRQHHLPKRC